MSARDETFKEFLNFSCTHIDSMSMNKQIRYRILSILYDYFHENPKSAGIDRTNMMKTLDVTENLMDANMVYLKEKHLVKVIETMGSLWRVAKINAFGIDVIENKEKYKDQFPFVQVQIVHGDNYGNMSQASTGSQITINQIVESFQRARDLTSVKTDISEDTQKEVDDNLTTLEDEIKKNEPELGKVQKIWKWLKGNASWVVPILKDIIVEGMKKGMA